MKKSVINWHETAKELPQPTEYERGQSKWSVNEPLLVIWNDKIKPSRYFPDTQTWEGHTKDQVPPYWVMLKEINILTGDDNG